MCDNYWNEERMRMGDKTKDMTVADLAIGKKIWVIAEGYIPSSSTGPAPEMTSHESICIVNASDQPALLTITIYFTDREPIGPYEITVGVRRSKHVRFGELKRPEAIPIATEYSSVIMSDTPIVVQHTRLDSRQSENALMTTIAYSQ